MCRSSRSNALGKLIVFTLLFALLSPAVSCGGEERVSLSSRSRVTSNYFATVSMLQLYDDFSDPARAEAFEETWRAVTSLLAELDAVFSAADPGSDVSRFNALKAGESTALSPDTERLLTLCGEAFRLSGGAYDPTVARLVDLFGFTPRFSRRDYRPSLSYDREKENGVLPLPDGATVEALRALTDFSGVGFSDGVLTKNTPPVSVGGTLYEQTLDLGGIGKGYAADRVVALLKERGYRYGYFSCGGSSVGILARPEASAGAKEEGQWGISVVSPRFSDTQAPCLRIFTRDEALSTSGDYEHAYRIGGVRYTHLIDPRTGWPVNMPIDGIQAGVCSVTVLGQSAALCDALSTALCVLGPEEAIRLMERPELSGYRYMMILYRDGADHCELVTDLPAQRYAVLDPEHYPVCSETDGTGAVRYTGTLFTFGQ